MSVLFATDLFCIVFTVFDPQCILTFSETCFFVGAMSVTIRLYPPRVAIPWFRNASLLSPRSFRVALQRHEVSFWVTDDAFPPTQRKEGTEKPYFSQCGIGGK